MRGLLTAVCVFLFGQGGYSRGDERFLQDVFSGPAEPYNVCLMEGGGGVFCDPGGFPVTD